MKEIYEKPEIKVIEFKTEDIITTSGDVTVGNNGLTIDGVNVGWGNGN